MTALVMRVVLVGMFLPTIAAFAGPIRVSVSAGEFDRADTSVCADLKLAADQMKGPVCVVAEGKTQPAQIEPLCDGQARVWWFVNGLAKGATREYEIKLGEAAKVPASEGFVWKDSSKDKVKSKELRFGDRPVIRYMYTPFDGTNKDTIDLTRKPYHTVFDPNGSRIISKEAGGRYPHHRGIFYGHNRVKVPGQEKTLDIWSGADAHQAHVTFVREFAGPVLGGHVVTVDWVDREGKPFATETRTIRVFRSPKDESLIQFDTTIATDGGPVALEASNNHHGGVQFRAAQEVAEDEKATRFLRPGKWASMPTDTAIDVEQHKDFMDLPWNAIQYKLGDRAYTVAYLCNPKNPRKAEMSERAYGRFGEYSTWNLTKDKPLTLTYRFWVSATHDVTQKDVDIKARDFASPPKMAVR